jgi:hypothetical protein
VAERFNAPVLKTGVGFPYRGFESLPIRFFFLRNRCLSRFIFLGSGIYLSPGCVRSSACVTGPFEAEIEAVRLKLPGVDVPRFNSILTSSQLAPMTLWYLGYIRIGAIRRY